MADNFDPLFQEVGQQYGIDPLLLKAQAQYESGLDPNFKNPDSSASGLTAFTDAAAKDYGVDRNDPRSSIEGQAKYLRDNYKKFQNSPDPVSAAISAYKTGPNANTFDPDYVKGVTDIYQNLKKNASNKQDMIVSVNSKMGSQVAPMAIDPQDDITPQDDFERELLGQKAQSSDTITPQDDFERELLAAENKSTPQAVPTAQTVLPQDKFEQETLATQPKTAQQSATEDTKAQYLTKLAAARNAVQNTGIDQNSLLSSVVQGAKNTPWSPVSGALQAGIEKTPGLEAALTGYAGNVLHSIAPGSTELGSAEVAALRTAPTFEGFGRQYNDLEQSQQALRQASKEQNPIPTTIGEVGGGLASGAKFPILQGEGALGRILGASASGTGYGTLYGLGQGDASLPYQQSMDNRLGNAEKSGALGLILGTAIPSAIEGGRGTANLFNGSGIDPDIAQLAKNASEKYDINIPGGLLSENKNVNRTYSMLNRLGLTGSDENIGNFTKAVSNQFGENTPKLTRSVMNQASDRIGGMYDSVRDMTPEVHLSDNVLTRLGDAEDMARQTLPDGDSRIKKQIDNILSVATKNNGVIPVETWHSWVGSKSPLTSLTKAGLDPASGPAMEIKNALYDAFQESAPSEAQPLLAEANKQYKNLKTVQQKGLDPVTGEFSPTSLASNVSRTAKKYGTTGIEDLQELGDIGKQFALTPSSHTTENYLLAKGLGGGLEAGLAFHDPVLAAKVAAGAMGTAAVGRGVGAALSSDWYRNRLINSALADQNGNALSNFFSGTNYIPSVAYGTNRLLQRPTASSQ